MHKVTPYHDINRILDFIIRGITDIFGENLVGLYLSGSLVLGDFDPKVSDIDLVAVLTSSVTDQEFKTLQAMHAKLVQKFKQWHDRIEVCYISVSALKHVKSRSNNIVNISPGEPFHRLKADKKWLMKWYLTREHSLTLFGPPPQTIIESISPEEFIKSVKNHAQFWQKWVYDMRSLKAQAYAILTMCRALYVCKHGEQVSKKQAALWVEKQFPQWFPLIQNALAWRKVKTDVVNPQTSFPETVAFVNFIYNQTISYQSVLTRVAGSLASHRQN